MHLRPTVAVLSPVLGGFYFGGILAGVTREVTAAGGRVVLLQTLDPGRSGDEANASLVSAGFDTPTAWDHVDGVVSLVLSTQRPYLDRLRAAGKHVVTAGHTIEDFPARSVVPDNAGGVRALVEHLVREHGHRRIGFLGSLEQSDMCERYVSYVDTLRAYGIEPDPALFYPVDNHHEGGGRQLATRLVAQGMPATALVVATDRNALGLLDGLRGLGRSVPDDVAVVAFDDIEPWSSLTPTLSTVDPQFAELGELAAKLLLAEIRGEDVAPGRHVSPFRFIARTSCGCTAETLSRSGSAAGSSDADRQELTTALRTAMSPYPASAGAAGVKTADVGEATARLHRLNPTAEAVRHTVTALSACAEALPANATHGHRPVARFMTEATSGLWSAHAASLLSQHAALEATVSEQYAVSMSMLDPSGAAARSLQWMSATSVRLGCLALWDGGPTSRRLKVAGVHDPDGALAGSALTIGTFLTAEQFPPTQMLDHPKRAAGDVTFVIPVKAGDADWGLLAVVGWIDYKSIYSRSAYNHWAALLTVAFEQERLQESIRTSVERYAVAARATNDGLWDWDLRTGATYYSGRCREMLGCDADANGKAVLFDAAHPDDVEALRSALALNEPSPSSSREVELRIRGRDASYRWALCRALPVGADGATPHRVVGSLSDVHDRKLMEEQLRRQALFDAVTGLPNRTMFLDRLTADLDAAAAGSPRLAGQEICVLFLDLDGFKTVNDTLGHAAGDQLLTTIAQRLVAQVRPSDMAARFGGDEFAVMVHTPDLSAIARLVERFQDAIHHPVHLQGQSMTVTASVGVAVRGPGGATADELLRNADIAMYAAKSTRYGSWALHDNGAAARRAAS